MSGLNPAHAGRALDDALTSAAASHPGRVRDHNEDACLNCPELGLWAVADGMGGHAAGEVASGIVVEELRARISRGEPLAEAVAALHHSILDAVDRGEGAPGMGSTLVAVQANARRYRIAWVGDSRAYLWSKRGLRALTRDHSYVQGLLDAGALSAREAAEHPDRNLISQALGVASGGVKVDQVSGHWRRHDLLLLCSDGLSGELDDARIAAILQRGAADLDSLAERLIDAALAAGGEDNVSLVLIRAPADASGANTQPIDSAALNRRWRRWQWAQRWRLWRRGGQQAPSAEPASGPTPARGKGRTQPIDAAKLDQRLRWRARRRWLLPLLLLSLLAILAGLILATKLAPPPEHSTPQPPLTRPRI